MKHQTKPATSPPPDRRSRLEAVIDAFETPLLRYAASILGGNHTLAQDAVQDAFVSLAAAWQSHLRPLSEAHLRNWLFKVVHNKSVSIIRSEETRKKHHAQYAADAVTMSGSDQSGSAASATTAEQMQMVMDALHVLIPSRKQVLLLRLQQGLSYEDIAAITGHGEVHCRKLLHESVKLLNAEIARMTNAEKGARDE